MSRQKNSILIYEHALNREPVPLKHRVLFHRLLFKAFKPLTYVIYNLELIHYFTEKNAPRKLNRCGFLVSLNYIIVNVAELKS